MKTIASDSTLFFFNNLIILSKSFKFKFLIILPLVSILSSISNLRYLGTKGVGDFVCKLYKSGLLPLPISKTSLKPKVVIKAVFTPFLSVMALITVVPPCTKKSISEVSMPDKLMVFKTPIEGSEGVLKDLKDSNFPFFSSLIILVLFH